MTQITPRKFYDEIDNFHEIRIALKRKRYNKTFKFLYVHFFNEHQTLITSMILQKALCISDHSETYQILSSLEVLNLLEKKKMGHRRVLFVPKNESWWHIFKKELDKDGTRRKD